MGSFQKAERSQAKARIAIDGPAGAGKTYTALRFATGLGGKIALIDTEHGSASKYSDKFEFDTVAMDTFHPQKYIDLIEEAGKTGYDVLVIDSLTHAWAGVEGALEQVDKARIRSNSGNSFTAWRDVTPLHNKLVEAILAYPGHVIATMRSKMEYILVDGDNGKKIPQKVGMAPIQREGMEYEFDIVGDMDIKHNFSVTKSRIADFADLVVNKPGEDVGRKLAAWLSEGKPQPAPAPAAKPAAPPKPAPQPAPAKPAAASKPATVLRSKAQGDEMFGLSIKAGLTIPDVQAMIKEQFGIENSKALTPEQADKFIEYLKALSSNAAATKERQEQMDLASIDGAAQQTAGK